MIEITNEQINLNEKVTTTIFDLESNASNETIEKTIEAINAQVSSYINNLIDNKIDALVKLKQSDKKYITQDFLGTYYFDNNGYIDIPDDEEDKQELINDINKLIQEINNLDNEDKYVSIKDDISDMLQDIIS